MDHLLQPVHRFPQAGPLRVDRRIVHQQLVLAVGEAAQDLGDVRLGTAIFVEIAIDLVAERDDPEEPAPLRRVLGIERFHGAAQFGQVGADAAVLVDRLDRPVEEAVRGSGRLGDLLAAHRGQLIDLLAEFRAVAVERGQFLDISADLCVELARLLGLQRHQPGGLTRHDRLQRLGWIELQFRRGCRGRRVAGHSVTSSRGSRTARVDGANRPRKRHRLYYRCSTADCKDGGG